MAVSSWLPHCTVATCYCFSSVVYKVRRKQEAAMLLLLRVRSCADDAEYEMLRQQWDSVNRPQYQRRT